MPRNRRPKGESLLRVAATRLLLGLALGMLVVAVAYTVVLDRQVRSKFEGKRWELPARVYARPLELYPGLELTAAQLRSELDALGYRPRKDPQEPGTFSAGANELEIVTRPFGFWDGAEPSRSVRVSFAGDTVSAVSEAKGDVAAGVVRLDPRFIGGIYPTHAEDRILVRLSEVPPLLVQALLAVEDRHFFEHHGVDPRAIGRALWANLRAGGTVQGGSTLTQQLVKNFYLYKQRSLKRKVKEAVMALLLEWHYSKEEILEAYLNEIYLGQDGMRAIHGFGLASWFYFGRPLEELELPHFALLVGLARGASYYEPRRHPARAKERRNLVLDMMREQGRITAEQAARAQAAPLGVIDKPSRGASPYPAFLDLVQRQLRRDYREEDLQSEGLQIFTTLDPFVQEAAETALAERTPALEKRRHLPEGKLEGAVVVTSREGGEVQAVVGGREVRFAGFNRALDAQRPVGSVIKPAVYLTALADGRQFNLLSLLDDGPLTVRDRSGRTWSPQNYDREYHGKVPLHDALAHSFNVATVRLGLAVGVKDVVATLRQLGVEQPLEPYPSLLLGAVSLTPLEVTGIYQTLAGGGFRTPLRAIRAVLTAQGTPLQRYPLEVKPAFDPAAVYLLDTVLQEVVRSGTGRSLSRWLPASLSLAGKTGTTDEMRDSWFAGFTGDRVAVVWLGRDDNGPAGLSGAQGAMQVWGQLMARIHPRPLKLNPPPGVELVWVDPRIGLRVEPDCDGAQRLPFLRGSAPVASAGCDRYPATGTSPLHRFEENL